LPGASDLEIGHEGQQVVVVAEPGVIESVNQAALVEARKHVSGGGSGGTRDDADPDGNGSRLPALSATNKQTH